MLPILSQLLAEFRDAPIGEAEATVEIVRQLLWLRHFDGGSIADVAGRLDAGEAAVSIAGMVARDTRNDLDAIEELLRDLRLALYVSAYGDPAIGGRGSYPAGWIAEARHYAIQPHGTWRDAGSPASR